MSRISRLDRSEVTPDMAALYDKAFAQRGNVPNMFRVMAHRPEIFCHHAGALRRGAQYRDCLYETERADYRPHQPGERDALLPGQPHDSGQGAGMDRRATGPSGRVVPARGLYPCRKGRPPAGRDRHPRRPRCDRRAVCRVAQLLLRRRDCGAALRHRAVQLLQPLQQRPQDGADQPGEGGCTTPAAEAATASDQPDRVGTGASRNT